MKSINEVKPEAWDRLQKGTVMKKVKPLEEQIGGKHYMNYSIQPIEYTLKNDLNFCQGNVIKYITRYKDKNGVEDLKKARHYIDILIEEEIKNGY